MTELLPENRGSGRAVAFLRNKFYAVFCWFPCTIALVFGVIRFLYPDLDGRKISLLLVLVFFSLCALWLWFAREPQGRAGRLWRWLYMPLAVLMCAVAIRMAWAVHIGPYVEPFSDFDWAYQAALGSTEFIRHHATFPSWGLYVSLIKVIFQFNVPEFSSAQVFNALINGISAVVVYYIALLATDKFRVAVIAGLLMGFMPSNIFYTNMLSPEFPSLLLLLLVILGMVITFKLELKLWIRALIWIGIGAVCALANYLKAVAAIVLIAYVIVQVINLDRCEINPGDCPKRPLVKRAAMVGLSIILMSVPFLLTTKALDRYVEKELGVSINHNQMSHFLFVGLNTKGEGQIHIGEYNHMDLEFLTAHDYNYELTAQWVKDFLQQDWAENYEDIPKLFFSKFQWAWQDDMIPAAYTVQQTGDTAMDAQKAQLIEQYAPPMSQAYYIVLMLLTALGVRAIKKHDADNRSFFLLCMYIFGFALLLLIGEAQSRYKCMVMPAVCIIAATGFVAFVDSVKTKTLKLK
jgi:hypothetical protein